MLTAKEAFQAATQVSLDMELMEDINNEIQEAARRGRFKLHRSEYLNDSEVDYLKSLGYKVNKHDKYMTISWKIVR